MSQLAAQEDLKKTEQDDETLSLEGESSVEATPVSLQESQVGQMLGEGGEAGLAPTGDHLMSLEGSSEETGKNEVGCIHHSASGDKEVFRPSELAAVGTDELERK